MSIATMVGPGRLDRVAPSRRHSDRLLGDAAAHIESAFEIASEDPNGGFQLAYDAGRKAASAVLAAEGLRSTSKGGHIATIVAVRELGIDAFGPLDRMRRQRNRLEYPDEDDPSATEADVIDAVASAEAMLSATRRRVSGRR